MTTTPPSILRCLTQVSSQILTVFHRLEQIVIQCQWAQYFLTTTLQMNPRIPLALPCLRLRQARYYAMAQIPIHEVPAICLLYNTLTADEMPLASSFLLAGLCSHVCFSFSSFLRCSFCCRSCSLSGPIPSDPS